MAEDRSELMRALAIPRNAVEKREELQNPTVCKAFGVFMDISGYTPFTESIIKTMGDRGIARLVNELDKLLLPCAEAALNNRGNIIAVEGDALLMTFGSMRDAIAFCKEVEPYRKAVARTEHDEYPLRMDIGIAFGNLYEFVAGDSRGRAYMACGSALRGAYEMEKHSADGDIVTNFPLPGAKKRNGHHSIMSQDLIVKRRSRFIDAMTRMFRKKAPEGYVESFRSPNMPDEPRSQLLSPAVAFSDFPLIRLAFMKANPDNGEQDIPLAKAALTDFFRRTRYLVEAQAGGFVDKLKAENSMFLFGAPKTFRDVNMRAFGAISKMHELHRQMCQEYGLPPLPSVTGMHRGLALCRPVLGRYTALGNEVNLAARLKASSMGEGTDEIEGERRKIRFSREMLDEESARMIRGFRIERQKLKGVEDTKTVFFDYSTVVTFAPKEDYILRENELEALQGMAESCIGRMGKGIAISVIGDEGSGKDRLLSLLSSRLSDEHLTYEVRCSPFFEKDPYRALFELMKKAYSAVSDEELFRKAIGKSPESGKEFSELLEAFRARLTKAPAAYIINNGDNIDEESKDFFRRLAPGIISAGCFMAYSGDGSIFPSGDAMMLEDLDEERAIEFANELVERHHPGCEMHGDTAREIFALSRGNPLYISELVKSLVARNNRLAIGKKQSNDLTNLMLKNVEKILTGKLHGVLEEYALMHSVPLMAHLVDREAELRLQILREKGILREDYEFSSGLLRKALADSIDKERKMDFCTRLAKAAEGEGMDDHRAIFEYFKEGRRTGETRLRALEHADRHVNEVAYIYLIRDQFYEDAIELADISDPQQRRFCGLMLHRKSYLVSKLSNDEGDIMRSLQLAEESLRYLKGTGEEYKAMVHKAAALCRLGRTMKAARGQSRDSEGMFERGKSLFEESRELALRHGKVNAYLAITNTYAGNLIGHCKEPEAALDMLRKTEERLGKLPPLEVNILNSALSAMFDKMVGDAAQYLGRFDYALENLELGLVKSEKAGFSQGILFCKGTQAEVYLKMGELDKAEETANRTLEIMGEQGIFDPEVDVDMRRILDDIGTIRREEETVA